ncbi:hypothetical protein EHH44_18655 [Mycolicibacter terrae]|uniref:Uncharacterized protein n=1 Tax=Mycolicibacter terrae TaxID=1788 RepID=A0ACD2EIQ7_9MYCO|nr:MmpS family transport accessory protein [Mycolicibacter terrae]RRR41659.1 hypothetical protein EHH44_18655 [Mycolicibacter terrae]
MLPRHFPDPCRGGNRVNTPPKRRRFRSFAGRLWLPVTVLAVIAFVALGVSRVQGMSQAISHPPAAGSIPATVVQINPKTITYEVFGSLGSGGRVVYADLNGAPIEVALTSLPWSHSETTTSPSASLSLVTQVDGDSVGCRIRVDGRVRDERSVAHHAAAAACTVTAA